MGYWGKNLVRNFHALGALRVVCDSEASRRAAVEKDYPGVEFSADYASVLKNPGIAAVALATPAVTHFDMARQALEAGKDVFVEKPLALAEADGEALVTLAARHQRILMVGHILRYHPAVLKLADMIRRGDLGRIYYLYSNRLNIGKIRTEENILWSFAPHDISVMLALLNEEPCEVTCHGGSYLSHNVADVTVSQFLFPSGVRAHIFVSWLHPFKVQSLVVVGSDKMAVFDDTARDKLTLFSHTVKWMDRTPTAIKGDSEVVAVPEAEPLRNECQHFLDCCRTRTQPWTDGREGLRVLRVLSACQRSLEKAGEAPAQPPPEEKPYFAHETACIDEPCSIGRGTKIWHFCHVLKGARVGERCILGQNVLVADAAVLGNNVKVQNNVSIYSGTVVEDDVFLGPSCVLTNVTNPRSQVNRHSLYEKTVIRRGATIGANATIVCGVQIGRYAFVAAGAVVARDVPDYGLVMGVPARRAGWVSRHGHPLRTPDSDGVFVCPESGYRYKEVEPGVLRCLDLAEDAPLPPEKAVGKHPYAYYKSQGRQTPRQA
jgi:UDP-2-acetamido-3-amino-2,3-dideoxy-glucuronate N-acetyltransferase